MSIKQICRVFILTGFACIAPITLVASPVENLHEIIKETDFFRGGGIPGVTWDLVVQNIEQNKIKNEIKLKVESANKDRRLFALISFLAPRKYRGQKLLLKDHNMWFAKPGLRRPVPISSRQRLTGSASNADVASANYYEDYTSILLGEDEIDGTAFYIFELVAKTNLVSYHKIKYWVSKDSHHGLKAEFFGKSGKMIKSAKFKYENKVMYKSRPVDLISHVIISDNINKQDRTILRITNLRFKEFNISKFQQKRLLD